MTQKFAKLIAIVIVSILPIMVTTTLITLRFDASWLDYAPAWNDEVYNWHQTVAFAEVGFDSGYYTLNENPAAATFSKAYTWGPLPYVYFGSIMRLVGIELYVMPLINLATLSIITLLALLVLRPTWQQLGMIALIMLTFAPILMYLPATMLETLHQSVAIITAVGFYFVLSKQHIKLTVIILTILLMLAGIMRPTWALLLFPLYVLASEKRNLLRVVIAAVASVFLTLLVAIAYYATTSPYPHSRNYLVEGDASLFNRISGLIAFTADSLSQLVRHDSALILAQRGQILLLIVLLLGWGSYLLWQHLRQPDSKPDASAMSLWEVGLHLYNLLFIYSLIIVLHNTAAGEDFRSMGVHLLLSLILLALMGRKWLFAIMITLSILMMPLVWQEYDLKSGNFNGQVRQEFLQWASQLDSRLNYDPDAPDAWCNTVTVSRIYLSSPVGLPLSINPGMGISHIFQWDDERYAMPTDFKARYLILTTDDFVTLQDNLTVQELLPVPNGALYENLAANC